MILIALVKADLDLEQSKAFVDDAVWANFRSDIEARFAEKGYGLEVDTGAEAERGIERRCFDLGGVWTWLSTLSPGSD